MNPLDTLQAMILAARADGDAELAEWLALQADDPDALARVTGTELTESAEDAADGRWLLEAGFTGPLASRTLRE